MTNQTAEKNKRLSTTVGGVVIVLFVIVILFILVKYASWHVSSREHYSQLSKLFPLFDIYNPGITLKSKLDILDALNNAFVMFVTSFVFVAMFIVLIIAAPFLVLQGIVTSNWQPVTEGLLAALALAFVVIFLPIGFLGFFIFVFFQPCTPGYVLGWLVFGPASIMITLFGLAAFPGTAEGVGTVVISGVSKIIVFK